MTKTILQLSIVSGLVGGLSIALRIAVVFPIGGLMEGNLIGGLITGLMFFLPLAFFGILIGTCSGVTIGLLFSLINVLVCARFHIAYRLTTALSAIFSFTASLLIYWYWLRSQAPLIDFSSIPKIFSSLNFW
jgi:hypothetical protein